VPQSWFSNTPLCYMWQAYCSSLAQSPLPTKAATGMVGTFLGDLIAQYLGHYARMGQPAAAPRAPRGSSGSGGGGASPRARRSSSSSAAAAAGRPFEYDPARCARLMGFSALVGTPLAHYWYILLDAQVLPEAPTCPLAVAAKVVLDQGLQTPVGMALFFASLKVFEGKPGEALPEVRSKVSRLAGVGWVLGRCRVEACASCATGSIGSRFIKTTPPDKAPPPIPPPSIPQLMPALVANWYVWPLAQLINFTVIPLDLRILYVNVLSIFWTAFISNMASGGAEAAGAEGGRQEPQRQLADGGGLSGAVVAAARPARAVGGGSGGRRLSGA
jgi:hypothetical protein